MDVICPAPTVPNLLFLWATAFLTDLKEWRQIKFKVEINFNALIEWGEERPLKKKLHLHFCQIIQQWVMTANSIAYHTFRNDRSQVGYHHKFNTIQHFQNWLVHSGQAPQIKPPLPFAELTFPQRLPPRIQPPLSPLTFSELTGPKLATTANSTPSGPYHICRIDRSQWASTTNSTPSNICRIDWSPSWQPPQNSTPPLTFAELTGPQVGNYHKFNSLWTLSHFQNRPVPVGKHHKFNPL